MAAVTQKRFNKEAQMMQPIEVSARMTIRAGKLEEFTHQATECIRQTKEKDTKTLRYDWFINREGTACEVREVYDNSAGLIEHRMHVGDALNRLFREVADNHAVTIYGDPSPQLVALVSTLADVDIQWYSFLGGLESGLIEQGYADIPVDHAGGNA